MKKCLLISSFVLIFLLVMGAASAADGDNMTYDSLMSVAGDDADGLEIEPADDEKYNSINDLNQEDVISDDGKDTPVVDVDNCTVFEGEDATVRFNVTDSAGSLISGDVNVTISGENQTVSKIINVNNESGQFTTADLIGLIKANDKWNIQDVYDIISSSVNSTNGNITEIISGFGEAYNGLNLNISAFISGVSNLLDSSDVNASRIIMGLDKIERGINVSMLMEGLDDIFNLSSIDAQRVSLIFDAVMDGFDFNISDILNDFQKGISFNGPVLILGIARLNKEFGFFNGNGIVDIIEGLGLKVSLLNALKAITMFLKTSVTLSDAAGLFKDILKDNGITPVQFIEKTLSQDSFSFKNIVYKLITSDFNRDNVVGALTQIAMAIKIDSNVLDSAVKTITNSSFNSSKVINELSEIAGINISAGFDSSKIVGGLYKVIVASNLNVSDIIGGLNDIFAAFKFHVPESQIALNKIKSSFSCNDSMIMDGLDRIVEGLGINVSAVAGQIIAKYGYFTTFAGTFTPGAYNISVEYLANERYDSARNDAAKLTVLKKMDAPIAAEAVVDRSNVIIEGSVVGDAKGIVMLEIVNCLVFVPLVNGNFTYNTTLDAGDYDVKVVYLGDMQFSKNSTSVSFTVKADTKITASDVKTTYGTSKNLVVKLTDAAGNILEGKEVVIKLNGVEYVRTTDSKGQVSVAVPNTLVPKTYTVSISFAGDDKCVESSGSAKVTVSKATPKITANAKTFKASTKTKKYTITLKNDKGKVMKNVKLTIKVNKKTYTAKTNSKGQATFKITKLTKKGKYTAVLKYNGSKYYNSLTKKVKITIK